MPLDATWTAAPYVLCDHCERETLVDTPICAGLELSCEHCGAVLRVEAVQDVRHSRAVVVRLPPISASFDDDELTPVEIPKAIKP